MLKKEIKLSKFNGVACENLYTTIRFITQEDLSDLVCLYNRVSSTIINQNWLKFRDIFYLNNILHNNGFIVGCYVEDMLIASALCEIPTGDYKDILFELGMDDIAINSTYISGYVMVDPIYRGNSLHRILLETRIEESILRNKKYIATAIADENIFSLRTVTSLGFDVAIKKENEHGITRSILLKELTQSSSIEVTA